MKVAVKDIFVFTGTDFKVIYNYYLLLISIVRGKEKEMLEMRGL